MAVLFRVFITIALLPAAASAQQSGIFALESALHYGVVWKHTPKLTTRTGEPLWGQEIGIRVQTAGGRDWHQWQRYPVFGVSALHIHLGEGSHGEGYGLVPHLSVPIFRAGWFTAFFRLGTGLAWIARPYDYFGNPGQNAVSSHWNNLTQFRLGGEARLGDHLRLNAGAALTHFSNGGTSLPNYGINLPSGYLGLAWSPKPVREADFRPAQGEKRAQRRFGGLLQTGLAVIEYGIFDGPKYPVWAGAASGCFYLNKVNRAHLGVDYEFNRAVYEYGLHLGVFEEEKEARRHATRLAVFVADEFLFGAVGVQLQMGCYVGRRFNDYLLKKYYSKLTLRAYTPPLFRTTLQPHLGITLKAHGTTAEYISLNTGLAF